METSMLMRRLRARLKATEHIQYILTSATLGGKEANRSIVEFGQQLCGLPFKEENIIRSVDASPVIEERNTYPIAFLVMLQTARCLSMTHLQNMLSLTLPQTVTIMKSFTLSCFIAISITDSGKQLERHEP